jgi:glycosyltransferase involved in cell wall biosynthesis
MKDIPRFSVITPSLNQCAYIEQTIRSVIDQEGPFEIEYYIMDGGSTDGSVDIIREYAESVNSGRHSTHCAKVRIQWRSQKDTGQSNAINCGLQQATGDYASYINSDDCYMPGAFAKVAEAFAANPKADFIYGDGDVVDEQGDLQWEWLSRPYNHRVMTSYHFLWNDFSNYVMQQATFWRTGVRERIGLFDEAFHYAMDVEYWVRAGAAGLLLQHIPQKLAKFRMIPGTKSTSGPAVFWSDTLEIVRRYRGTRKLQSFLAYYYFNLARHNGWDLDKAQEEERHALQRWEGLTLDERQVIETQRSRAYGLACYLIANELQKNGQGDRAWVFLRKGLIHLPAAVAHFAGLYPLLKHTTGPACAKRIDRLVERLIAVYRKRRYDYRYHQRASDGGTQ